MKPCPRCHPATLQWHRAQHPPTFQRVGRQKKSPLLKRSRLLLCRLRQRRLLRLLRLP